MNPPLYIEIERQGIFIGDPYRNVSAQAFSLSITRGRTDYAQQFRAGTASILFRNLDGRFDPDNTSSPIKDCLQPGARIRIVANTTSASWETDPNARPLFVGEITDIAISHDVSGQSTATITAADGLAFLAQQQIPAGTTYAQQTTTNRIVSVLGTSGINVPQTSGDLTYLLLNSDGQSICATVTLSNPVNALSYCQQVAVTEQGDFFVRNQGGVFLSDRYWILRPASFTFSDSGGGTDFTNIERIVSWAQLYNELEANRTGQPAVTRSKSAPFPLVLPERLLDLGEVFLLNDSQVADLLDYALVKFAATVPQIPSLTVFLSDKQTSEQLDLLALELTDAVNIEYTPAGMSQLSLPSNIQLIRHQYTIGAGWRLTFGFVPRNTTAYLTLDDPTLGRLDFNALAF